jgi:hypothetical protein
MMLALITVLLFGLGTWTYLYRILDSNWRARREGSISGAYHSDLFPRWLGTREALRYRADPYSRAVTQDIQRGYYGRPLSAGSRVDPQGFVYPAYVMLLIAPLALLPFSVAEPLFFFILLLLALSIIPLFTRSLNIHWNRQSQSLATAVLFASFPLAEALYVEQFTILVIFCAAAGTAALIKGRLWLAGGLLAVTTIKPQLSFLLLSWFALWAITHWQNRRGLVISFLVTWVSLGLGAELLLPGWVTKWLGAAFAYVRYPEVRTPTAWLLQGPASEIVTMLIVFGATCLLWGWRRAEPSDEKFRFAIAMALSATLVLVPTWPSQHYNQMLLLPATLVVADMWRGRLRPIQRILALLMGAVLAFSSVGAFLISTAMLAFGVSEQRLGHLIELPLFSFAVTALIVPVALLGILCCPGKRHVPVLSSQG